MNSPLSGWAVNRIRAFQRSVYLTLILCCVCLSYSEWDYLPEVSAFAGAVILMMIVAYRLDGRAKHLSLKSANFVGAGIFVLAIVWLGYHFNQPQSLMNTLPWPAGGLPFIAPLLILLMPAKLFRPKHNGDWWTLYGISLAGVGLAMSLAEDGIFIILVLLYALVAVWSLTLFYFHRFEENPSISQGAQFSNTIRVMGLASVVALPVFFLTPRTEGVPWNLLNSNFETGLAPSGEPDLSRTGQLKPSKEEAFVVTAYTKAGKPILNLPLNMRFRGPSYTDYLSPRGRWQRGDPFGTPLMSPVDVCLSQSTERPEVPDIGPDAFFLDFQLFNRMPVFADPVMFKPNEQSPIAVPLPGESRIGRGRVAYARQLGDSSFAILASEFRFFRGYVQVTRTRAEPTSFALASNEPRLISRYLTTPPRGLVEYSRRLLDRLIEDGTLPSGVRDRASNNGPNHEDHALIASAFSDFLSGNSFTYTLDLRREDRNIDPIEDFLVNTHSGHCERFASALVLLLRGIGIPAQLVTGYRGCESMGGGQYRVRQEHAHAWAEVLLSKPDTPEWYWQGYDPTPATSASEIDESGGLLATSTKQGQKFFTDYVINLNPDSQARLHARISEFVEEYWRWLAAGLIGIIAFAVFLRRLFRRNRIVATDDGSIVWFCSLMNVLHRRGLEQVRCETPREFAIRARAWLKSEPDMAKWSELPMKAAILLYSIRFAEASVSEAEISSMKRSIQEMSS